MSPLKLSESDPTPQNQYDAILNQEFMRQQSLTDNKPRWKSIGQVGADSTAYNHYTNSGQGNEMSANIMRELQETFVNKPKQSPLYVQSPAMFQNKVMGVPRPFQEQKTKSYGTTSMDSTVAINPTDTECSTCLESMKDNSETEPEINQRGFWSQKNNPMDSLNSFAMALKDHLINDKKRVEQDRDNEAEKPKGK